MALPSGLPLNSDLGKLLSQLNSDLVSLPTIAAPFTTITNRAQVTDLANDLSVRMGIDRVMMQDIHHIPSETGPNGEAVYGAVNDRFNQVRLVGTSWVANLNSDGAGIQTAGVNDYIEITFYGTDLNILTYLDSNARDARVAVDGGAESANILSVVSNILTARGYAQNQIVRAASNLSLGMHTVKIRTVSGAVRYYGFEAINSASTLNIRPGSVFKAGQSRYNSAASNLAHNATFETGTLGTRGGRVVVYQKDDNSIAKAVQPVGNQLNLAAADHSNEEVIKVHHYREFGTGRTDDFSSLTATSSSRAYTLDDDTTTLVGVNVVSGTVGGHDTLGIFDNTGTITFTWVGTGLDVVSGGGTASLGNVIVDGTSVGAFIRPAGTTGVVKIVSGLPYGTHTARFTMTAGGGSYLRQFITYQPKKPTISASAIELADYNVVANYDGASITSGTDFANVPVGTIFKANLREFVYTGANWVAALSTALPSGWNSGTTTNNNQPGSITFYGTGFVLMTDGSAGGTYDYSLSVDGALYAGATVRQNATNLGGGSYRTTGAGGTRGVIDVTGLTYGLHTVVFQRTAGTGNAGFSGFYAITPIHSAKSISGLVRQNTSAIGSQGIGDSRMFADNSNSQTNISQAIGITGSPTTTSSSLNPIPEMSLTHLNETSRMRISYSVNTANIANGSSVVIVAHVDGFAVTPQHFINSATSGANQAHVDAVSVVVPVTPGYHKIDLYWLVSGGGTGVVYGRSITAEDVT